MPPRVHLFLLFATGFQLVAANRAEGETLVVVVLNSDTGAPLANRTLIAHSPLGDEPIESSTDEHGVALFSVPPGLYLVTSTDRKAKHRMAVVKKGATTHLGIVLEPYFYHCGFYRKPVVKSWETGVQDDTHLESLPVSSLPLFSQGRDSEHRIFGLAISDRRDILPQSFLRSAQSVDFGVGATQSSRAAGFTNVEPIEGQNLLRTLKLLGSTNGGTANATRGFGPIGGPWSGISMLDARAHTDGASIRAATLIDLEIADQEATLLTAGALTRDYRTALAVAQVNSRKQKDFNAVVGAGVIDESFRGALSSSKPVTLAPRWRYGARMEKTLRKELLGFHRATIATESYVDVDSTRKAVVRSSVAVEDSWSGLPRTLVTAGVRLARRAGANFALPNVGITHDVTNDYRSRIFGHIGRYFDRRGETSHAAILGVENEIASNVALRLSLTRRGDRRGREVAIGFARNLLSARIQYRYDGDADRTHRIDARGEVLLLDKREKRLRLGFLVREGGDLDDTVGSGVALRWSILNYGDRYSLGVEATRAEGHTNVGIEFRLHTE